MSSGPSNAVCMPKGFPKCILGESRDRHPIPKDGNTVDEMSSGVNCNFSYTLFRDLRAY
jgi:hypothetical protein